MRKIKLKKKYKLKIMPKVGIIIFIIMFFSIFMYVNYINKMTKNIETILDKKINTLNNNLVNNVVSIKSLQYIDINDLIIINKNKNDEVIYVDFNLKNSYKMLRKLTVNFENKLVKADLSFLKVKDKELKKMGDMLYLDVPLGSLFSNYYTSSFGPKIPVIINFNNSLSSNLSVDVKNYGINNCLIKVYLNFDIYEDVYIPASKKTIKKQAKVLIGSKIIQGNVPDIYGGSLTKQSTILSSTT